MLIERATYTRTPIQSVRTLARILQLTEEQLKKLADSANDLYRIGKRIEKPDGTIRTCYDAAGPLKSAQARIQCLILKQVSYPSYLMGGISDKSSTRGYIQNALRHAGARLLIQEDIDGFFPATSDSVVDSIWREFFGFGSEVAEILTRLTTYNHALPQGAKTSSYLANLVFWATEPELFRQLADDGFAYTRYVDDITISASFIPDAAALAQPMRLITTMVITQGYRLKRKKHQIVRAGDSMRVTGVAVDVGVSIGQEKRAKIRAAVHACEFLARSNADRAAIEAAIRSAQGRVAELKALHPKECATLRRRLDAINY